MSNLLLFVLSSTELYSFFHQLKDIYNLGKVNKLFHVLIKKNLSEWTHQLIVRSYSSPLLTCIQNHSEGNVYLQGEKAFLIYENESYLSFPQFFNHIHIQTDVTVETKRIYKSVSEEIQIQFLKDPNDFFQIPLSPPSNLEQRVTRSAIRLGQDPFSTVNKNIEMALSLSDAEKETIQMIRKRKTYYYPNPCQQYLEQIEASIIQFTLGEETYFIDASIWPLQHYLTLEIYHYQKCSISYHPKLKKFQFNMVCTDEELHTLCYPLNIIESTYNAFRGVLTKVAKNLCIESLLNSFHIGKVFKHVYGNMLMAFGFSKRLDFYNRLDDDVQEEIFTVILVGKYEEKLKFLSGVLSTVSCYADLLQMMLNPNYPGYDSYTKDVMFGYIFDHLNTKENIYHMLFEQLPGISYLQGPVTVHEHMHFCGESYYQDAKPKFKGLICP
jgi:hypothetical protein